MSLDVYLEIATTVTRPKGSGIFVRANGQNEEISREEWDARFPGREPIALQPEDDSCEVFSANITHNLGAMAEAAGIYNALWRPETLLEGELVRARHIAPLLAVGIDTMLESPSRFKSMDAKNGWGTYSDFVPWLQRLYAACKEHPEAIVQVSV